MNMNKIIFATVLLITTVTASAQNKKFSGVWTLVSIANTNADSSKTHPYGENPQGLLIFESTGEYAIQILKADRPKIVSGNKNTATPEENTVLVKGSNSHFGNYVVDEQLHTITYKVAHAFFPNWEGTSLIAHYTLECDILKSFSTSTTNGGSYAVVTWKRK